MSAPTQKTNGLPVTTIAAQSPDSSSPITRTADSNAERPSVVGFVWSSPLSTVTSAIGPTRDSTRFSAKKVSLTAAFSQTIAQPMPMPMQSAVSP